ncbi:MAG: glycoside hydrolase family 20 zincin-like fold domain-containing protein [bacterium]
MSKLQFYRTILQFCKTTLAIVLLLIIFLTPTLTRAQGNGLSVIPMPKKVTALSGSIPVTGNTTFVIENKLNKKYQIGIEEINAKLTSLGGAALPVKVSTTINEIDSNSIIIGNLKSALLQGILRLHNLKIDEPGEQGYIIKFITHQDKELILIGGGDDQGALYGCITLCALINKISDSIHIIKYDIWDKPDFKYRAADGLISCLNQAKEIIHFALHNKINIIWSGYEYSNDVITSDKERFKDINNYAWERGIRIIYNGSWNIGRAPVPEGANQYYYPYAGMIGHMGMLFCWSNDELLEKKGDALHDFIQNTGAKAIYLHSIDSGGASDPELWSKRCDGCRKRFGEERAQADAHVINTFYDKIKKASQDALLIVVAYPYLAEYTGSNRQESIVHWLEKLTQLIPGDVFLCVREDTADNISHWCQTIKQPSFIYHASEPGDWEMRRPYITSFRFAKTFYVEGKDNLYWNTAYGITSRIQFMGIAEYSWNTQAPGSEYITGFGNPPLWQKVTNNPEEITRDFLPRACKILFENAANEMMEVISFNLSPYLMVNSQSWLTQEHCKEQLENANRALVILKAVENKIPARSKHFYGAHIANSTACQCFAQARIGLYAIDKYLKENAMDAAGSEKIKILDLLNKGEQSFYRLEKSGYVPWNGSIDFIGCKNKLIDELNKLPIVSKVSSAPCRPADLVIEYMRRPGH